MLYLLVFCQLKSVHLGLQLQVLIHRQRHCLSLPKHRPKTKQNKERQFIVRLQFNSPNRETWFHWQYTRSKNKREHCVSIDILRTVTDKILSGRKGLPLRIAITERTRVLLVRAKLIFSVHSHFFFAVWPRKS